MTTGPREDQAPLKVEAAFVRSNFYRVVHADGAFGGAAPSRNIRMTVYSEAQRIPNLITYDFFAPGALTETSRTPAANPTDIVREMEVDIVMTLPVARSIRDWLDGKVKELEMVELEMVGGANDDSV